MQRVRSRESKRQQPSEPREVRMALKQQLQFRAELMSVNDLPVAEPPKLSAPQSRIESSVRIIVV
jgi:hypothetical protein